MDHKSTTLMLERFNIMHREPLSKVYHTKVSCMKFILASFVYT